MSQAIPKRLSEKGYTLVKQFNPGGQSETSIISKDGKEYLLKRPLAATLSTEQKFRFKQEAEALKLIDGQSAPKVYDYSFDEEPYILMEFIEGKPLTNIVNGKAISLEKALDITFQILEILEKVHEIGLLHRDIKPDNIIIKGDGKVYLIDFGLCRIDQPNKGFHTPNSKEIGNRFLRLPEFGKGEKVSSSVSDITFVVGLLFYMLSGQAPHILLDKDAFYPQQRNILPETITKITSVMYTFDKGFAYHIAQRFQNAQEMKSFIEERSNAQNNIMEDNPAEEFSRLINTNELKSKSDIVSIVNEAHSAFILGVNSISGQDLISGGSGPNQGIDSYTIVTNFFMVRRSYSQPQVAYSLVSVINPDLSSITFHCDSKKPEYRSGNHSPVEKERMIEDYKKLGQIRGKEVIRDLILLTKTT